MLKKKYFDEKPSGMNELLWYHKYQLGHLLCFTHRIGSVLVLLLGPDLELDALEQRLVSTPSSNVEFLPSA